MVALTIPGMFVEGWQKWMSAWQDIAPATSIQTGTGNTNQLISAPTTWKGVFHDIGVQGVEAQKTTLTTLGIAAIAAIFLYKKL